MADIKKEIKQLSIRKQVLYILIFSLVTIMVWVGASLVFSQRRSGIDPELAKLTKSLVPNINGEVLTELASKKYYSPAELADFPIYLVVKSQDGREEQVTTLGQEPSFSPSPQEAINQGN